MKIVAFLSLLAIAPCWVYAASPALYLSPQAGDFSVGETFVVDILVDTQGQDVNAVAAYLDYPADLLAALSLDITGSTFEFVVEQNYGLGRIEVSGGTPTPGFNGVYKLATVEFQAVGAGTALISFLPGSAVLTDRGNENIFQGSGGVTYKTYKITNSASPQQKQPVSNPVYVYEEPVKTFVSHSLLAALVGKGSALADFLSFIGNLMR